MKASPLDQFRVGAYRPQRRAVVVDLLDDGYHRRLPPTARAWLARFLRAEYGANATLLRQGLHADVPRAVRGPRRARRWWRGVERLWPGLTGEQRARALRGAERALLTLKLDCTRRRAVYAAQRAASRDVYSLGRVCPLLSLGGET